MSELALSQPNRVQSLLVTNLTTQCAAHFLNSFSKSPYPVILDVVRTGIHGSGGWIDHVNAWFDACEAELDVAEDDRVHWRVKKLGPWVYEHVAVADVAVVVMKHTRSWDEACFAAYSRLGDGCVTALTREYEQKQHGYAEINHVRKCDNVSEINCII